MERHKWVEVQLMIDHDRGQQHAGEAGQHDTQHGKTRLRLKLTPLPPPGNRPARTLVAPTQVGDPEPFDPAAAAAALAGIATSPRTGGQGPAHPRQHQPPLEHTPNVAHQPSQQHATAASPNQRPAINPMALQAASMLQQPAAPSALPTNNASSGIGAVPQSTIASNAAAADSGFNVAPPSAEVALKCAQYERDLLQHQLRASVKEKEELRRQIRQLQQAAQHMAVHGAAEEAATAAAAPSMPSTYSSALPTGGTVTPISNRQNTQSPDGVFNFSSQQLSQGSELPPMSPFSARAGPTMNAAISRGPGNEDAFAPGIAAASSIARGVVPAPLVPATAPMPPMPPTFGSSILGAQLATAGAPAMPFGPAASAGGTLSMLQFPSSRPASAGPTPFATLFGQQASVAGFAPGPAAGGAAAGGISVAAAAGSAAAPSMTPLGYILSGPPPPPPVEAPGDDSTAARPGVEGVSGILSLLGATNSSAAHALPQTADPTAAALPGGPVGQMSQTGPMGQMGQHGMRTPGGSAMHAALPGMQHGPAAPVNIPLGAGRHGEHQPAGPTTNYASLPPGLPALFGLSRSHRSGSGYLSAGGPGTAHGSVGQSPRRRLFLPSGSITPQESLPGSPTKRGGVVGASPHGPTYMPHQLGGMSALTMQASAHTPPMSPRVSSFSGGYQTSLAGGAHPGAQTHATMHAYKPGRSGAPSGMVSGLASGMVTPRHQQHHDTLHLLQALESITTDLRPTILAELEEYEDAPTPATQPGGHYFAAPTATSPGLGQGPFQHTAASGLRGFGGSRGSGSIGESNAEAAALANVVGGLEIQAAEEAQIKNLQAQVDRLRAEVEAVAHDRHTLQSRVYELEAQVDIHAREKTEMQAEIQALQAMLHKPGVTRGSLTEAQSGSHTSPVASVFATAPSPLTPQGPHSNLPMARLASASSEVVSQGSARSPSQPALPASAAVSYGNTAVGAAGAEADQPHLSTLHAAYVSAGSDAGMSSMSGLGRSEDQRREGQEPGVMMSPSGGSTAEDKEECRDLLADILGTCSSFGPSLTSVTAVHGPIAAATAPATASIMAAAIAGLEGLTRLQVPQRSVVPEGSDSSAVSAGRSTANAAQNDCAGPAAPADTPAAAETVQQAVAVGSSQVADADCTSGIAAAAVFPQPPLSSARSLSFARYRVDSLSTLLRDIEAGGFADADAVGSTPGVSFLVHPAEMSPSKALQQQSSTHSGPGLASAQGANIGGAGASLNAGSNKAEYAEGHAGLEQGSGIVVPAAGLAVQPVHGVRDVDGMAQRVAPVAVTAGPADVVHAPQNLTRIELMAQLTEAEAELAEAQVALSLGEHQLREAQAALHSAQAHAEEHGSQLQHSLADALAQVSSLLAREQEAQAARARVEQRLRALIGASATARPLGTDGTMPSTSGGAIRGMSSAAATGFGPPVPVSEGRARQQDSAQQGQLLDSATASEQRLPPPIARTGSIPSRTRRLLRTSSASAGSGFHVAMAPMPRGPLPPQPLTALTALLCGGSPMAIAGNAASSNSMAVGNARRQAEVSGLALPGGASEAFRGVPQPGHGQREVPGQGTGSMQVHDGDKERIRERDADEDMGLHARLVVPLDEPMEEKQQLLTQIYDRDQRITELRQQLIAAGTAAAQTDRLQLALMYREAQVGALTHALGRAAMALSVTPSSISTAGTGLRAAGSGGAAPNNTPSDITRASSITPQQQQQEQQVPLPAVSSSEGRSSGQAVGQAAISTTAERSNLSIQGSGALSGPLQIAPTDSSSPAADAMPNAQSQSWQQSGQGQGQAQASVTGPQGPQPVGQAAASVIPAAPASDPSTGVRSSQMARLDSSMLPPTPPGSPNSTRTPTGTQTPASLPVSRTSSGMERMERRTAAQAPTMPNQAGTGFIAPGMSSGRDASGRHQGQLEMPSRQASGSLSQATSLRNASGHLFHVHMGEHAYYGMRDTHDGVLSITPTPCVTGTTTPARSASGALPPLHAGQVAPATNAAGPMHGARAGSASAIAGGAGAFERADGSTEGSGMQAAGVLQALTGDLLRDSTTNRTSAMYAPMVAPAAGGHEPTELSGARASGSGQGHTTEASAMQDAVQAPDGCMHAASHAPGIAHTAGATMIERLSSLLGADLHTLPSTPASSLSTALSQTLGLGSGAALAARWNTLTEGLSQPSDVVSSTAADEVDGLQRAASEVDAFIIEGLLHILPPATQLHHLEALEALENAGLGASASALERDKAGMRSGQAGSHDGCNSQGPGSCSSAAFAAVAARQLLSARVQAGALTPCAAEVAQLQALVEACSQEISTLHQRLHELSGNHPWVTAEAADTVATDTSAGRSEAVEATVAELVAKGAEVAELAHQLRAVKLAGHGAALRSRLEAVQRLMVTAEPAAQAAAESASAVLQPAGAAALASGGGGHAESGIAAGQPQVGQGLTAAAAAAVAARATATRTNSSSSSRGGSAGTPSSSAVSGGAAAAVIANSVRLLSEAAAHVDQLHAQPAGGGAAEASCAGR